MPATVFRALRKDEMRDQCGGNEGPWYYESFIDSIKAKDSAAMKSLTEAVERGSREHHQYICATKDPRAALYFAESYLARDSAHVVVEINPEEYQMPWLGNNVHDVSAGHGLVTETSRNFAHVASEVLLEGPITAGCIVASYQTDQIMELPRNKKLAAFVGSMDRDVALDLLKNIREFQHSGIQCSDCLSHLTCTVCNCCECSCKCDLPSYQFSYEELHSSIFEPHVKLGERHDSFMSPFKAWVLLANEFDLDAELAIHRAPKAEFPKENDVVYVPTHLAVKINENCLRFQSAGGPKCFLPGTLLETPSGSFVRVEHVEVGWSIVSSTGSVLRIVNALSHKETDHDVKLVTLTTDSAQLTVTASHRIVTADGHEQLASKLNVGDGVLVSGNLPQTLRDVHHFLLKTDVIELTFYPDEPVEAFNRPGCILSKGQPLQSTYNQASAGYCQHRRTRRPGMNARLQRQRATANDQISFATYDSFK